MNRSAILTWALLLFAMPLLQGSSCFSSAGVDAANKISGSLDSINKTMADGVSSLNNQSNAWQGTLKELEGKLAQDGKDMEKQIASDVNDMIDHIDNIAKDGAQFAQEGLNCEADIIANHAKIGLENLLTDFLNKWSYKGIKNRPSVKYQPTVCTVNPTAIVVADWKGVNGQLVLSGVDFNLLDTKKPLAYIKHSDNTEKAIPANYVARQTNYRIAINIASLIEADLISAKSLLLELRWDGRKVNPNQISIVATKPDKPDPPKPGPTVKFVELEEEVSATWSLDDYSETKGGPCTHGYHREQCQVVKLEGSASCAMKAWTTSNKDQCECIIRFIAPPFQSAKCRITITQTGDPK
jgi:hypothetical protein